MSRALLALALLAFGGHSAAAAANANATYTCSVNMTTSSATLGCGCDQRDGTGYDKDAEAWTKPAVPCELGDCGCHPKCYDCPGTYKYVYQSSFQVWQYTFFFLFVVAFGCLSKTFVDYVKAQKKRGLKNGGAGASAIDRFFGFPVKVQLWVLMLSWAATLGRLIWLNSPRNSTVGPYGAEPIFFYLSQTAIGFFIRVPEVMYFGAAILLGLVFKETVDKSKNMGQKGPDLSANKKGVISVVVLFALSFPGALMEPENIINIAGYMVLMLYCIFCSGLLVMYGRSLGKMIHGSGTRNSSEEKKKKMIKTAKTILFQVRLLSISCFGLFIGMAFNIMVQNTPWDHMIFWAELHFSEWVCPMTIAYSLKQGSKGKSNPNVRRESAASSAGSSAAGNKVAPAATP